MHPRKGLFSAPHLSSGMADLLEREFSSSFSRPWRRMAARIMLS